MRVGEGTSDKQCRWKGKAAFLKWTRNGLFKMLFLPRELGRARVREAEAVSGSAVPPMCANVSVLLSCLYSKFTCGASSCLLVEIISSIIIKTKTLSSNMQSELMILH